MDLQAQTHSHTSHTLISCFPVAVETNCRLSFPVLLHYFSAFLSLISNLLLSWANPSLILFFPSWLTKKDKVKEIEKHEKTDKAWKRSAGRCLAPDFLWEWSGDKEIKAWPCERKNQRVDKDGVYLPGQTEGDWTYQTSSAALTCA